MIFGLEGAIDWDGKMHAAGDVGYPHTVVAQPHEIPGRDRYSAEIYVLTQESIQGMDESGSVCYHPLKRLIGKCIKNSMIRHSSNKSTYFCTRTRVKICMTLYPYVYQIINVHISPTINIDHPHSNCRSSGRAIYTMFTRSALPSVVTPNHNTSPEILANGLS